MKFELGIFLDFIGLLLVGALLWATQQYKKSLERFHEHLLDWSNYLHRAQGIRSDEYIKKAEDLSTGSEPVEK